MDGPFEPFAGAAAVVIRATWDYHQELDGYRAWLGRLDAARTFNAPGLVRWNLEKSYLTELAAPLRSSKPMLPGWPTRSNGWRWRRR